MLIDKHLVTDNNKIKHALEHHFVKLSNVNLDEGDCNNAERVFLENKLDFLERVIHEYRDHLLEHGTQNIVPTTDEEIFIYIAKD